MFSGSEKIFAIFKQFSYFDKFDHNIQCLPRCSSIVFRSGYFYIKDATRGETMHGRKENASFTADFVWSSYGFDAYHDHLSLRPQILRNCN